MFMGRKRSKMGISRLCRITLTVHYRIRPIYLTKRFANYSLADISQCVSHFWILERKIKLGTWSLKKLVSLSHFLPLYIHLIYRSIKFVCKSGNFYSIL